MVPVRRLEVDVLKPHDPPLVEFTQSVAAVEGVDAAEGSLVEMDREVQNVTLAVEGAAVDVDAVEARVERLGGSVHSVDRVVCGSLDGEREVKRGGDDPEGRDAP